MNSPAAASVERPPLEALEILMRTFLWLQVFSWVLLVATATSTIRPLWQLVMLISWTVRESERSLQALAIGCLGWFLFLLPTVALVWMWGYQVRYKRALLCFGHRLTHQAWLEVLMAQRAFFRVAAWAAPVVLLFAQGVVVEFVVKFFSQ